MIDHARRAFGIRLLALGSLALTTPTHARTGAPLQFGVTPVVLDEQVGVLARWADWIGTRVGRPVAVVQRARYREILDLLLRGRLDFAWICGYPYLQHQDRLELLVVPRWHGEPLYRSEIIVAADSAFTRLADLRDGLFAWADPDSNSGWLYPRYALLQAGTDPERFFRRTFFTWGHPRSVQAVSEGLADGAAVDAYVREALMQHQPVLEDRLRVVHCSPLFGFPPIVAGPALAAPLRERLREALVAQHDDAVGRALLGALNLDGFSVEGSALYADIAAMMARVGRGTET